jgi:alcohol dehydrogenase (cytochrome c)
VNWAEDEYNDKGQPVRIPAKDHHVSGALVSNANQGASNWPPPSFSPDYGLFYVTVAEDWAMYYTTELDPRGAMGLGGKEEISVESRSFLRAIDPTNGEIRWSVEYPTGRGLANGVLTTAGRLLFAGDRGGNIVARDPATGTPLWHSRIGNVSNAPQTYLVDGKQHMLVASGDMLYAFKLY